MKDVCLKSGPSTNNIEDIIGSRVVWNVPEEDRSYNGVITSYELYIEDKFPYSASLLFYLEPTGDIVDKYDLDQMRYGGVYLEDLIFSNKIVEKVVITNNNVKTY